MSQLTVQNKIQQQYINKNQQNKQQNFNGFGDIVTTGLQLCDQYPMVGVSVVDLSSTIVPRTAVDMQTGVPAALETFRRESSGLIVNCLTPSLFVLGMAKLLNKPMLKDFKGLDMSNSWANEDSLNKLTGFYKQADQNNKVESYVTKTLENLKGFDEKGFVSYSEKFAENKNEKGYKDVIKLLTDTIEKKDISKKEIDTAISSAYKTLAGEAKAAETICFGDEKAFSSNLSDLLRDHVDIGRKIFHNEAVSANIEGFSKKALKMVNTKSLMGLAIIFPIAISMQAINRAITRKKYNTKGAPIYKDFGKGNVQKEMTPQEKSKFFGQKCIAAAGMVGLALASMMKKPNMKMFQFKGMFPTVDQCRWIATATIASRFFAAEDKNELRESAIRDMTCFAGLYFLGDYVAKAAATVIEKIKPDVKLINRLVADDKSAGIPKRLWNWVSNYKLKSFDEVKGAGAKNMRSLCQVSNIAFAIGVLGVLLPVYNRRFTNKKIQREKEAEAAQKAEAGQNSSSVSFVDSSKVPKAFSGFEKFAS